MGTDFEGGRVVTLRRTACPTRAELISASEGTDSPWETRRVLAHLPECAACRAKIREAKEMFAVYAEAQSQLAPASRCHTISETELKEGLRSRERRRQMAVAETWPRRNVMIAAALVPLIVVTLLFGRPQQVVLQAEPLLMEIVMAELARPHDDAPRVRMRLAPVGLEPLVRFAPFDVIRDGARGGGGGVTTVDPAFQRGAPPALVRALAVFHFDWRHPLSAASFAAWRTTLMRRKDFVTRTRDGLLRLRTTTPDGLVRSADLAVRPDTYRVVQQALVVEDLGRVEISALHPRIDVMRAAPTTITVSAPDPDSLDRAELDARLVLRAAGVDLGQAIRVSNTSSLVRVDGSIASVTQRLRVTSALAALPRVQAALRSAPAATSVTPRAGGLSHWLDRAYGDAPARKTFIPELSRLVATVPDRLSALTALATRYPEREERRLSPAARAKLRDLTSRHYAALRADLTLIRLSINVLVGSHSRGRAASQLPSDWRVRATLATGAAVTLQQLIDDVFAHDDLMPEDEGARRVDQTFATLWDVINPRQIRR